MRALAAGADEQHGRACVEVGGGSGEQLRHGDMLAGKGRGEGGAFGGAADVDDAPVLRQGGGEFGVDGGGECLRLVVASSAARYADAGLPHGGEVVLQHFAREWRGKAGEDFQRFQRLP